jgi:hypothetical protein
VSWAINNLTAPDTYTQASTLDNLPTINRVNIDAVNASIYWQLKQVSGTGLYTEGSWGPEVFMLPGSRPLYRPGIIGIRFRAAVPAAQLPTGGSQAQVTVEAID